ncbi:hypothetical protein SESBI_00682 [Sesbania bispinosa]|nr:hypothetical protein SESBI_00682 [Sesbania bispinosa]
MEPDYSEEEEALTGKLRELLAESDNEETGQFRFQEEMVEEVMQDLYKEIAFSAAGDGPVQPTIFIDDGKNGSCGASISASASTVMAGIEVASFTGGFPATENVSAVVEVDGGRSDAFALFGFGEENKMQGFDRGDIDDEWVGRVLSWGEQIQQNQVQDLQVVEVRNWWL